MCLGYSDELPWLADRPFKRHRPSKGAVHFQSLGNPIDTFAKQVCFSTVLLRRRVVGARADYGANPSCFHGGKGRINLTKMQPFQEKRQEAINAV